MAQRVVQRRAGSRRRTPTPKLDISGNEVSKVATERKLAWIAAGGPRKHADAMAVVAFAESGADNSAVNSIGATGAWQIYNGPNTDTVGLRSLTRNARAAVKKFKDAQKAGGTGYEPWVSSKGTWGKIVDEKTGKVDAVAARALGLDLSATAREKAATKVPDAIVEPLEGLAAIGKLAIGLSELLLTPEGWRQIAKVTIGGILLIWALNQLSKSIFDVNPVGKVASVTGAGAVRRAALAKTSAATGGKIASKLGG